MSWEVDCTWRALPPAHLSNIDPSSLQTLPVVSCHSCRVAVASQLIRTLANTVTVYMNDMGRGEKKTTNKVIKIQV